jgi:hypothetical protein
MMNTTIRTVGLDGYRAMADREGLKVVIEP